MVFDISCEALSVPLSAGMREGGTPRQGWGILSALSPSPLRAPLGAAVGPGAAQGGAAGRAGGAGIAPPAGPLRAPGPLCLLLVLS